MLFSLLDSAGSLWAILVIALVVIIVSTFMYLASRYKRCPSDAILVVYGRVGKSQSSNCIHGGGAFIWPLIQHYAYMSLTPMTISIPLQNALSKQNIRIHVPSTFTVGISTEPAVTSNAAERLLGLRLEDIEDMAREIIFGQLRLTVASLDIEQINQDRESFLGEIRRNVEPELNKIGLNLINVNITDITDESNYIESIGKKAASTAVNRALVDVAQQEKVGSIGQAEAVKEQKIKVAQNVAEAVKGEKAAEANRRIFVQQQETSAAIGEAEATREKDIQVAVNFAEADKGRKKAEADKRIFVQAQESDAITGENTSKAEIASANATLAEREAEALKRGDVAKLQAQAEIQKANYLTEQERLKAEEVVREEIDKQKIQIAAEAEAEKIRREAQGEADAILAKYEAEAKGIRQVLDSKAEGYRSLVESCQGDANAAGTLLMIEKLEDIVAKQVEAISNVKIDKVTVWDSGSGSGKQGSSTANFLSSLIGSVPPLQEVAKMAGVELPQYLGKMVDSTETPIPNEESDEEASPVTS